MKELDRLQFANLIVSALSENPDWLPDALSAIASGMDKALQQAKDRGAQYDLAFRCALSLADPKRLRQDTKDLLNSTIVEAIGGASCKVEREFLERVAGSQIEEPMGDTVSQHGDGQDADLDEPMINAGWEDDHGTDDFDREFRRLLRFIANEGKS